MEKELYIGLPYKSKHMSVEYSSIVDVLELDEDGQVVVTGQHDLQAEIDSYASEVDINNIIKRCVDPLTLSVIGQTGFVDNTLIPDNYIEANKTIEAKFNTAIKIYDSLTEEQKKNFKSFADFMQNYEKVFNDNPVNEAPKADNINKENTNE